MASLLKITILILFNNKILLSIILLISKFIFYILYDIDPLYDMSKKISSVLKCESIGKVTVLRAPVKFRPISRKMCIKAKFQLISV